MLLLPVVIWMKIKKTVGVLHTHGLGLLDQSVHHDIMATGNKKAVGAREATHGRIAIANSV
jgi:hypothetical protein